MDEENKSEIDLNNKMVIKQKIEQVKTEFSDLQQKIIASLNFLDISTVLSVSDRIDTIPLGGMLEAHDSYAVKIQNKAGTIETVIVDKNLQPLATIKENNNIELTALTQARFEEMIGKPGKQTPRAKRKL